MTFLAGKEYNSFGISIISPVTASAEAASVLKPKPGGFKQSTDSAC